MISLALLSPVGTNNARQNEEQQQQYQTSSSLVEGRLKEIIDASVWEGLQSQVRPFVQRAWKVR